MDKKLIQFEKIFNDFQKCQKSIFMVGMIGIPGSGKSTTAYQLKSFFKEKGLNCEVIPMDGYHIERKNLDDNGLKYRGAPFTFDIQMLKQDLERLLKQKSGRFPSFDHSLKDPKFDDILVENCQIVIVEGLYLFLHDWQLNDLFDKKIWIKCDENISYERLASRHVESGIVNNIQEAMVRIITSDSKNSQLILNESNFEGAQIIENI